MEKGNTMTNTTTTAKIITHTREGQSNNYRVHSDGRYYGLVGLMANGRWSASSWNCAIGAKCLNEASETRGYESSEMATDRLMFHTDNHVAL
jgi:hypothetical protein